MKRSIPLLSGVALFVFACGNGYARLGENAEQLQQRYGPPVRITNEAPFLVRSYQFREYWIDAFFLGSTNVGEVVLADGPFAKEEAAIMAERIAGRTLKALPVSERLVWSSDDVTAVARGSRLTVGTRSWFNGRAAVGQARAKQRAAGF